MHLVCTLLKQVIGNFVSSAADATSASSSASVGAPDIIGQDGDQNTQTELEPPFGNHH